MRIAGGMRRRGGRRKRLLRAFAGVGWICVGERATMRRERPCARKPAGRMLREQTNGVPIGLGKDGGRI